MAEPADPSSTQKPQPRPKRHKIDLACDTCRIRKVKCDGDRPACGNCKRRTDLKCHCHYGPVSSERHPKQEPQPEALRIPVSSTPSPPQMLGKHIANIPIQGQAPRGAAVSASVSLVGSRNGAAFRPAKEERPSPSRIDSMTTVLEDGEQTKQYFGSSSAGSFMQRIKAAIDAKLGVSATTAGNGAPPTLAQGPKIPGGAVDYTLPSRHTADRLTNVYWHYVNPIYPFLERQRFQQAYECIFTGTPISADERIFITTLNVIFALSTQLLESLEPGYRDDSSNWYFRKAQELLSLNLFYPASVELVQCLLLVSQYLQCTNYPHQMWMVVGAAVRTAQGLGLHLPETSDVPDVWQRELYKRLWYGCVLMDRMVALTHGRPAMISQKLATGVPFPLSENTNPNGVNGSMKSDFSRMTFFVKSVELYEIINQMTMTLYSSSGTKHCKKDQSLTQGEGNDEDLETIISLDHSLSQWEKQVPEHLNVEFLELSNDEMSKRQAVILRIRFLQARLLLFRPMLFRFCLESSPQPTSHEGLRHRLLRESTILCVTTAQDLISVLSTHQKHDGTAGLLPAWWYRVYYVFSAATILLVAKLRPDLFEARGILRSWDEAMAVLNGHEKFSLSVGKCVAALKILSDKVFQIAGGMAGGQQGNERGDAQGDQFMNGMEDYPEIDLEGIDFDAGDLNAFNADVWSLLNNP